MPYAADYFVRPTNGNDSNAGTSYGAAFKTLQKALDTATAGKIIGCCAETAEVLTAAIDDDTNSGTQASRILVLGLNSAGEYDGTRYTVNGNSAAASCLIINGRGYKTYRGIDFTGATGDGVSFATTASTSAIFFVGCRSYSNGGDGWDTAVINARAQFYDCAAYSNTASGWALTSAPNSAWTWVRCSAYSNGASGWNLGAAAGYLINCLGYKNTANGLTITSGVFGVVNCTFDANVIGVASTSAASMWCLFSRFTNNSSFAIQTTTGSTREDFCYYFGNGAKFSQTTGAVISGMNSVDMAADGYTNDAANDYSLVNGASAAEGRWVSLALDATNTDYFSAGMQPNPDFATASNVLPADTTDGVTGTSDKLYTAAEEATRNTSPGVGNVVLDVTWKYLNATQTGTLVADGIVITSVTITGTTLTAVLSGAGATQGAGFARVFDPSTGAFVCAVTPTTWSNTSFIGTLTKTLPAGTYRFLIVNNAGTSGTKSFTTTSEIEVVSAPNDPVKQRIVDAVEYGLTQITTDSGYNYTIRRVYSPSVSVENITELPAAIVDEGPEECANPTRLLQTGGNEEALQNSFDVQVTVIIPATEDPVSARNKALADLKKYFGTHWFLPGSDGAYTAFSSVYARSEPHGVSENRPITAVTAWFRVWYREKMTDPTTST